MNPHLKMDDGRVVCPRCDDQGFICRVRIKALGITAFVCEECNALWLDEATISIKTFQDYATYMMAHGLPPQWNQLESIEERWKT